MRRHYQCYSDILTEHGFIPISLNKYWTMKRERCDRKQLLALSRADDLYEVFLTSWLGRIEDKEYLMLDEVQDSVLDTLRAWKGVGVRLLLATMRNNVGNLHWQLEREQLDGLFDHVVAVGSVEAGAGKARHIRPLLLGPSDESVWVGDTEVDVGAARELGIDICAVSCGLRTKEYLASLSPDMLEPDLASFARRLNLG